MHVFLSEFVKTDGNMLTANCYRLICTELRGGYYMREQKNKRKRQIVPESYTLFITFNFFVGITKGLYMYDPFMSKNQF